MGKKSKQRFIEEKRQELVDIYNKYLSKYGKDHVKVRYKQQQIEEFDKDHNKQKD